MKSVVPFEVGVVVADIDRLLPFYRDVLGFAVVGDAETPPERSRPCGLSPDGYRVVRLETSTGDRLKLARPRGGALVAPPAAESFAMHAVGGFYVTFIVEDLAGLHTRLQHAGATIRSQGIVQLRAGLRLLLVADPEGNFLEFLQYDDIASYRPSKPLQAGTGSHG